jgi:hypothetical protein
MRQFAFWSLTFLGAALGALIAYDDGWGVLAGMTLIGGVVGLVVGGVITGIGSRRRGHNDDGSESHRLASEERDRNFWRDRGHPPFMKPPDAHPDHRMFDPDRQG